MTFKHSQRTVPELNTTSTADISFILLVFFLVITSMDVDKGLSRRLPPIDNKTQTEEAEVSKSNVLALRLLSNNTLEVDGKPLNTANLRARIERFVSQEANPERHIITLEVSRSAKYDTYFTIQNEITAAYRELRNGYARQHFGRSYDACTQEQRDKARAFYPQHLTESTATAEEGGAK